MAGTRRSRFTQLVGSKYDLSRDFTDDLTTETLLPSPTVAVVAGDAAGLVITAVQVIGKAVHWRQEGVTVGSYVLSILAPLSDGEIVDHTVYVTVADRL